MRTFLAKGDTKRPINHWTMLRENSFFEGKVPEGYKLCASPGPGYLVVDVDRHGDKDGFKHSPQDILDELNITFNYATKNNGVHFWFAYSGDKVLLNKASGLGIDLRFESKGYVVVYIDRDIRDYLTHMRPTSKKMNEWLESLFS